MRKQPAHKPFRIIELMVLVAATAVAFVIERRGVRPGIKFTTRRLSW